MFLFSPPFPQVRSVLECRLNLCAVLRLILSFIFFFFNFNYVGR